MSQEGNHTQIHGQRQSEWREGHFGQSFLFDVVGRNSSNCRPITDHLSQFRREYSFFFITMLATRIYSGEK